MQVESEGEPAMVDAEATLSSTATAVLTAPLSLEGGLAAELRPANLVQRVLSLFRNVRPGSDLSHFQVKFNSRKLVTAQIISLVGVSRSMRSREPKFT